MTERTQLRSFEGHKVGVRFLDGTRIECQLISAPRTGLSTRWILTVEGDVFVSLEMVEEVWDLSDATQAA